MGIQSNQWRGRTLTMGHTLLNKAILLHKMANIQFDLLIAVAAVLGMAGTNRIDLARLTGACKDPIQYSNAELHLKDVKSLQYLKNPKKSNSERQSICPFKEYTFIKHPLMRLGKSQQGMLLTINTPK